MEADKNIYRTRETLLQKLKNKHDDESWEDFVFYYRKFIYMICRRMNVSHSDSEEIIQQVLIRAWSVLPEFEYDKNKKFRGWLGRVTRDYTYEFFRRVGSENSKIEKASNALNSQGISDISKPEIEKIADEEWSSYVANLALVNIKDKFSDKVIEVFLKLSEGSTISEVSEKMEIPVNTVSVYKKRVTSRLCEEIRRLTHELG